jgi:hypothetical protein
MPHAIVIFVVAVVIYVLFKFAARWLFSRAGNSEYLRKRGVEQNTQEQAEWIGQTGLDEETERELPRYLRRELGEFLDDPKGLRAADLNYKGIHQDEHGPAHFWQMPARDGEISYAYVEIDSQGKPTCLGWGDRHLPAEGISHQHSVPIEKRNYTPPPILESALRELQSYMHGFYPEREAANPIPLDFWIIEDDDLFLEVLSYMPLKLFEVAEEHFADLPIGFQLAYPIFWLEDDYQFNGWTALTNAGEYLLPLAIDAYEQLGMATEAAALAAALRSCVASPDDDVSAEEAYKSVPNVYADEQQKFAAILKFFRANAHLWETYRHR